MLRSYIFRSAFKSLWREKWINTLSVLTVASSLLMLTLISIALYNTEIITRHLPDRFSLVVYLKDNITPEQTQGVIASLRGVRGVKSLTYISKEDAFREVKETLKSSGVLEGLDENPLSPSVELRLGSDFVTVAAVKQITREIKGLTGVDDISYGEEMVESIHRLRRSLMNTGLVLFFSISAGVVFVIYSTVKILFYRRKEEMEIWKLLGATRGFIRVPFLIEGGTIGFLGGALGILAALIFYVGITYRLNIVIPMLRTLPLPVEALGILPVLGLLLGVAGSLIAVGRLRL